MSTAKEQIKQNLEKVRKGVVERSWSQADPYVSSDYTLFESASKMTWKDQKNMFEDAIDQHEIDLSNIDIHVSNDESMAWCTLKEHTTYKMGGENVKQNTLVTLIWEKEDDTWKVVHFNRSVNPAEIPKAQMEAIT